MTIEQDLHDVLAAFAGLTDLVPASRIYQVAFPSGTEFPCVTYQVISGPRDQVVPGTVVAKHPRYQLTAWSEDRQEAADIGEQLELAAVSGIGAFIDVTVQGGAAGQEPDAGLFRYTVDAILLVAA